MNLEKLKDTARKHEQREDWRKAIDVYQRAIQQFETGKDADADLAIYNRVGDLYLKLNDPGAAVDAYERAAELYAEQGFLNNAIALAGKVLRVNPGRVEVYLRLAHLHARKNVASESKRNLLEYIERMNTLGKLDDAFRQVQVFADQHAGNQDIRLMLVDLLRAASRNKEAESQLEKIAAELEARGDRAGARRTRERLHAQSADDAEGESDNGAAAAPSAPGGLVFLETGYEPPVFAKPSRAPAQVPPPALETPPEPSEPVAGFETVGGAEADAAPVDDAPVAGLDTFEPPVLPEESTDSETLADLESAEFTVPDAEPVAAERLDGLVLDDSSELSAEAADENGLEVENLAPAGTDDVSPDEPPMTMDAALEMPLESMPQERVTPLDESLDFDVGLVEDSSAYTISLPTEEPDTEGLLDGFTGGQVRYLDDFDVGEDVGGIAAETEPEPEPEPEPEFDAGPPSIEALEDRILDDPDDPAPHVELARLLSAEGDNSRAAEEFVIAVQLFEAGQEWDAALDASDRLLSLEPDEIGHQQKRVELAYRSGDRERLMTAYLGLADALVRSGESVKAAAVYQRVLEHDPGNAAARDAVEWLTPRADEVAPSQPADQPASHPAQAPTEPADQPASRPADQPSSRRAAEQSEGFVDFGAMVIDEEGPRDTRMRVDKEDPTGDEQKDFLETLAQFKKGIEANLGSEDYEAHYDLGVAFKEMGLLDEAIAEFQKALRAPNGRLRTSEALGVTFFEKQQYAIAETILHRAVEALEGGDDEKIGLLYWLGRACEAQRKPLEARTAYERALAVDIRFMDLSDRIHKLSAGHSA